MRKLKELISGLSETNELTYFVDSDKYVVKFEWNTPVTDLEIFKFEETNNLKLDAGYINFLKISNGAVLFEDAEYCGWGCKIYSLDEILFQTSERKDWGYDLLKNWLVFAEFYGESDFLIFDEQKIIDAETGYPIEEWEKIGINFSDWLEGLIESKCSKFWRK